MSELQNFCHNSTACSQLETDLFGLQVKINAHLWSKLTISCKCLACYSTSTVPEIKLCKLSFWNEMHTTWRNTKMTVIFHSECNMSLVEAGLRILAISQHTIFKNVWFHIQNGFYIHHNTEENTHFHLMTKLQGTEYRMWKCKGLIKRFDYTQLLFNFPFMHLKLTVHRSLKTNTWTKKIQFSLMVFHLSTKNIAESSATWSDRSILQTEQVFTVIIHATWLKRRKTLTEIKKSRNSTSLTEQGLQKCP